MFKNVFNIKKDIIPVIATYYVPEKGNFGGATVLCSDIRNYLKSISTNFIFIDLQASRFTFVNIIRNLIYPFRFYRYKKAVLMVSQNGFKYIFPYFFIFSKLFNCELILRVIGGDADAVFEKAPKYLGIEKKMKQIAVVFLETKYLCHKLNYLGNVHWLPNSRQFPIVAFTPRNFTGRFLFVGRICEAKGIDLMIEAFEKYLPEFHLDIYGNVENGYNPPSSFSKYFKGTLPHNLLVGKLQEYDFMLLPTHWDGEGYPGIILESYAASTPVIASRWRSIPEIVVDGETGILIDPYDAKNLAEKILKFDQAKFIDMQEKAFNFHAFFETKNIINNYFLTFCD